MQELQTLNGVLVVAANDALLEFVDTDGEVSSSVSLPAGRHDLSRYQMLNSGKFVMLHNVVITSSSNASKRMKFDVAAMLSTSANADYVSEFTGDTRANQRYETQIREALADKAKRRVNAVRDQREHDFQADQRREQVQREKDREEKRRQMKADRLIRQRLEEEEAQELTEKQNKEKPRAEQTSTPSNDEKVVPIKPVGDTDE